MFYRIKVQGNLYIMQLKFVYMYIKKEIAKTNSFTAQNSCIMSEIHIS